MSLSRPSYVSPDDRQRPRTRPRPCRALDRGRDERVADDADAVRVGDRDGRGQHARLADPLEAGQLAVAVEPVAAGEDRLVAVAGPRGTTTVTPVRTGPSPTTSGPSPSMSVVVPDAHARHVGDGVARARAAHARW